jgi:hypothetical protein
VTNLNTNEIWQAETNASYHYYERILDSKDVSANDTLEFNAKDPDATRFNTTDHTVTPTELNDGGLFNFNLTLHPKEEEEVVNDTANAEISVKGTVVTCNYTCTQESDGNYEVIEEEATGGKPSSRISSLEHKWTINVIGGTKTQVTFYLEASRSSNSEVDDFNFSYSKNENSGYEYMVTVNSTEDTNLSCELPTDLNGTVYIRVVDTDQTVGNGGKDTIYIDHMFIRSVLGAPDTTPPTWDTTIGIQSATDTGNGEEVMITYGNATDADSPPVKYNVYYNTSSPATGTGCTEISDLGPSPYIVTGLTNGQLYYFAVRAEDSATPPNEDTNTVELNATPTAPPPIPPTPYIKYGYVFNNDSTACNGPVVNVTNVNKNEIWPAETNASYHYYELILDSFDLSATDTLEVNARDTAATQFNTTDHTVTQTELNNGGLFNFNLTLHPPAGVNDTAWAEETVKGEVIGGNFISTHESDGDYEVIEEESTSGNPSTRISSLEHKWTINVTGGSKVTFHLQAHRIDTGDEGDDFVFAYWNGSDYVPMVTVNTLGDTNLSYEMPPTTSGTVSIRVTDTDQTPGKYSKATIHIDHMYIRSEP